MRSFSFRRHRALAILLAPTITGAAAACPLGSWRTVRGGSLEGTVDEVLVNLMIAPRDIDRPVAWLPAVALGTEDIGSTFSFDTDDDGFDAFAAELSNGHDDYITIMTWSAGGDSLGHSAYESMAFFGEGAPDFEGRAISEIRMTFHDVHFVATEGGTTSYGYDVSIELIARCRADIDGDGSVGVGDLLPLLGDWGACEEDVPCTCDHDCDGSIGVFDLLEVLGSWGACP